MNYILGLQNKVKELTVERDELQKKLDDIREYLSSAELQDSRGKENLRWISSLLSAALDAKLKGYVNTQSLLMKLGVTE